MIETAAKFQGHFLAKIFYNLLSKFCALVLENFFINPITDLPVKYDAFRINGLKSALTCGNYQVLDIRE